MYKITRSKINHYLRIFYIFYFLLQLNIQWSLALAMLTSSLIVVEVDYKFKIMKKKGFKR